MSKKIFLSFFALIFFSISVYPRHSHAIAGAALRVIGGSLAERALTATMQRIGYEVGSVSAAEKARKRFNLDLWEGIGAPDGPAQYQQQQRMSYERAVALHNELNKKATPIPSKPGWGKIALSALSFLTAADLIHEGYEAYRDGREMAMLADSSTVLPGEKSIAMGGYYVCEGNTAVCGPNGKTSPTHLEVISIDSVSHSMNSFQCSERITYTARDPFFRGQKYVMDTLPPHTLVDDVVVVSSTVTGISSSPIVWGYVPTPVPEPLPDSYPVEVPDTVYIEVPIRDATELDREVPSEWPDAWEVTDPLRELIEEPNPVFDPANDPLEEPVPEPVPQPVPEPVPGPVPFPEPFPVPDPSPPGEPPSEGSPEPTEWAKKFKNLVTTRFPFSLPFDAYFLLSTIAAEPKAPFVNVDKEYKVGSFSLPFKFSYDFSKFDPYMTFFRGMILVGFGFALIFATSRFFGGAK